MEGMQMLTRQLVLGLCLVILTSVIMTAAAIDAPIANAVMNGDRDAVRLLLKEKANVNAAQGDGMTALHWAAFRDDLEIGQLLVQNGANVKAATRNGALTPIFMAAKNGSPRMLELLLKGGADANTADVNGTTVLMIAATAGNPEAVQVLLKNGANVNAKEKQNGQTALMFAAWENRGAAIRALTAAGADMSVTTKTMKLERDTVDENGNPINATANDPDFVRGGERPRGAAVANAEPPGNLIMGGLTALLIAARDGQMDAVQALVESGADVNQVSAGDRSSSLVISIANGHYAAAKYLVDHGANPNAVNIDGLSPLWATVNMRYAPISWAPNPRTDQEIDSLILVKALLEHGADPNVQTLKRKLWFSPTSHDQTWVDPKGSTPFFRAAASSDVDAMKILVAYGADPNRPSAGGTTPLIVAAGLGWVGNFSSNAPGQWMDAVKFCVEHGADVNAVDVKGYTALHGAAIRGDNDMVKYLLEKGAKIDAVTKTGDSVADMANGPFEHAIPHPDTRDMLIKLGSKDSNNCRSDQCVVKEIKKPRP
jgi:ankyrin repeat protein